MNTEHAAICGAPLNEATDPRTAFTVIAGECLAAEAALRGQNDELRRKLDDMRAERDEYKQAADALACALNVLDDVERRSATRPDLPGKSTMTKNPGARCMPARSIGCGCC